MKLLIVDDEFYSVENTRRKLQNRYPDFEQILCAYNIDQAMELFTQTDIAIMICDIEMPGGSGLELLDRIRILSQNTICIFLTAYAKFEYISKAMKLSSSDYLLKPVDDEQLFLSIDKAILQYKKQQDDQLNTLHAGYWKASELSIMEQFWMDLLTGSISSSQESILWELKNRKLSPDYADQNWYLITIQPGKSQQYDSERILYEFTLRNIIREYFYSENEMPVIVCISRHFFCLPVSETIRTQKQLVKRCREALKDFVPYFPNTFNFFVSDRAYPLARLADCFDRLQKYAHANVTLENHVFDLSVPIDLPEASESSAIPLRRWADLFLQRNFRVLKIETVAWLTYMQNTKSCTRESLTRFYYSFLRILLSDIENDDNTGSQFYQQLTAESGEQRCSSIQALKDWIPEILAVCEQWYQSRQQQDITIAAVKDYIHNHLSENLNRESLAAIVHFNPDYLSHIFKKETGMSLTSYIIDQRISEAKRLLAKGDVNIRDIAIACGFQNISYFSRQFKKSTGMTPREFRR